MPRGFNIDHQEYARKKCPETCECGCNREKFIPEYFCSPDETWKTLCGREGYFFKCPNCGKEFGGIVTCMN